MDDLSSAKRVLLDALDAINDLEADMGAEVRHLCVAYSVYKETDEGGVEEQGGWCHTPDPKWIISALLQRTADLVDDTFDVIVDEEEDDG